MQDISIVVADSEADLQKFWELRDEYMLRDIFPNDELGTKLTREEQEWFLSSGFRDPMNALFNREVGRAYPVFFLEGGKTIGFCSYCTYLSEDGKCFIVDFCILPEYRNNKAGSTCFQLLKDAEITRGAKYFALNCSSHRNKHFWENQGFVFNGYDEHDTPIMILYPGEEDSEKSEILMNFKDKRSIYQLFRKCFMNLPITYDIFYSLFEYQECDIITKFKQNELIGYSAVCDNRVVLLCVAPEYQRKGYGRQLIQESEKLIRRNGYDTAILGGTESKLFIGALTDEEEWSQKHNYFFEKCGYMATNGCLEMIMKLRDFNIESLDIPLQISNITFEYWNKADKTELLSAVREVEEDWVKYFEYDTTIFAAMEDGRCIGFTILSFDDITLYSDGLNRVGMVGCVGVIPGRRKEGIGLAMVAQATNELKKNGCDESYIHYTYLDRWYGKLGYRSILWFWFGKKKL